MREVCARRGFDAARTDEIAARAGVSKGTLYRFFRSKEELFLATVLAAYEEAAQMLAPARAAAAEAPPLVRLDALVEALAEALPALSRMMPVNFQAWGVVARDPDARSQLFAALRERYAQDAAGMTALVREAQAAGAISPQADPEAVVRTVFAVFDGYLYRSTFDPEQANADHLRGSLRGVLAPLRTRGGRDGAGS